MNTVSKKLSILFGILFVLMAIIGGVASYSLIIIKNKADTAALISLRLERVDLLRNTLFKVLNISKSYSEGELENQFEFEALMSELESQIRGLEDIGWSEGELPLFNSIKANLERLKSKTSEIIQKSDPTGGSVATVSKNFLLDELDDIRIDIVNTSEIFFYTIHGKFEETKHSVREARDLGIKATIVISLFSFFFGGAGVLIFARRILVNPIKALEKASIAIGEEKYETKIEVVSKDEIGTLARAFEKMAGQVKEHMRSLRESEEKVRLIISNAMDGLITITEDGTIDTFNPASEQIFGYSADEVVGKNISMLMPEPYKSEHPRYLNSYLSTGETKILGVSRELKGLHKNGTNFPIELSVSEMLLEENRMFIGMVQDISAKKEAEEKVILKTREVENLNNQKDLILNSSGEGIYGLDLEGRTIFANVMAVKMLGYTLEEMLHVSQHQLIHHSRPDGSPYPREECKIYAVLKDGELHRVSDEVFWKKDGTSFPVEYVSTPIMEDGKVAGAVVTFKDITDRKQGEVKIRKYIQEIEANNAELQKFTYSASHDLQEPLRKVIMFGDRLKDSKSLNLEEKERDMIDRMQKASLRMRDLIEDLLKYSRLIHLGCNYEPVSLTEVVKEVIDDLEIQIELSKGIVQADSLPTIEADKIQMRQLFQNIISNGLKYIMPDTPPKIVIECSSTENNYYTISIKDNGIGFDEKYTEKIFEPFERLNSNRTISGSGMGLFICQKIVIFHNGSISVESRQQKGTVFHITLPEKQPKLN